MPTITIELDETHSQPEDIFDMVEYLESATGKNIAIKKVVEITSDSQHVLDLLQEIYGPETIKSVAPKSEKKHRRPQIPAWEVKTWVVGSPDESPKAGEKITLKKLNYLLKKQLIPVGTILYHPARGRMEVQQGTDPAAPFELTDEMPF